MVNLLKEWQQKLRGRESDTDKGQEVHEEICMYIIYIYIYMGYILYIWPLVLCY